MTRKFLNFTIFVSIMLLAVPGGDRSASIAVAFAAIALRLWYAMHARRARRGY